jgi:dipeptidyl aminopeptidase/acylaminoacyl peptidase
MDRGSVASRLHVVPVKRTFPPGNPPQTIGPQVSGKVRWENGDRTLYFDHDTFSTLTYYQVILDGGYRDAAGNLNSLRHSWQFITEEPLKLAGSSPSEGDTRIDPTSYLVLAFTRAIDVSSIPRSVSITPQVGFDVRGDENDPARVTLAPRSLLAPNTTYTMTVLPGARDAHGNPLPTGTVITFRTGPLRPLDHWVTMAGGRQEGGPTDGVWLVNGNAFPRQVLPMQLTSYSWSPDGSRLLVHQPDGGWAVAPLFGNPSPLPLQATWADFLAGPNQYAFLQDGVLGELTLGNPSTVVATGVQEAAVAPGGRQVAFVVPSAGGWEIDVQDAGLHTRSRVQTERDRIDQLAWSPDGKSLAYRTSRPSDPSQSAIRVRPFTSSGATSTLATGQVSSPAWQSDSRHLFFTAVMSGAPTQSPALLPTPTHGEVPTASPSAPSPSPSNEVRAAATTPSQTTRIFRRGVGESTNQPLSPANGMPAGAGISVRSFSVSADGRQIAFLATYGGQTTVWLMNSDGTGLIELAVANSPIFPYVPSHVGWTPR